MYERYFGLEDLPFRLTPDPKYLYMSAKHREAFAHLLYGLNEGSGFVAVTGEVGAGKTTLIRALLREADTNLTVVSIVNPVLTPLEMLQAINHELGLESDLDSKQKLFLQLRDLLLARKEDGSRVLVIVDEAQNLEPPALEQLRLISNLETETEKLIQIVLAGQPELRETLERHDLRQLNQRVTVRWHLEGLDREETAEYVRHRMRVAGAQNEVFSAEALDLMYRHSRGTPRLINILGHRSLLVAYTRNSPRVTGEEMAEAIDELGYGKGPLPQGSGRRIASTGMGMGLLAAAAGVGFFLAGSFGFGGGFLSGSGSPGSGMPGSGNTHSAAPGSGAGGSGTGGPGLFSWSQGQTTQGMADPTGAMTSWGWLFGSPRNMAGSGASMGAPRGAYPGGSADQIRALYGQAGALPQATGRSVTGVQPGGYASFQAPAGSEAPVGSRFAPQVRLDGVSTTPPRSQQLSPYGQTAPQSRVLSLLLAEGRWDTAVRSVSSLMERWGESPLGMQEQMGSQLELENIAASRGLRYLTAKMNLAFLRVLDLPALLELELPNDDGIRYVLLDSFDPATGALTIAGGAALQEREVESWWNGRAHVVWRDSESLLGNIGPGSGGPAVRRLQSVLIEAGLFHGTQTGFYDAETEAAVRAFQDSHYLISDGVVDPITQVLLYNSLRRIPRPTLAGGRSVGGISPVGGASSGGRSGVPGTYRGVS